MIDKSIKNILKTIGSEKNRNLLQELYQLQEISYNGFEYILDGQDISENIRKLKEQEVVDYDEYSGMLTLEHQTDEYFRYLTDSSSETNIADIKRKEDFIIGKLKHIRLKKESEQIESGKGSREAKEIQKALRAIPSIINKNYIALSNSALFAFKTEENIQIKISILEDCKRQLKELVSALNKTEKFLNKHNQTFVEILPNPKLIDKLKSEIILFRKTILSARETTSIYLSKTLDDGNFIKKLNKISLIIKENQLRTQTNFYNVVAAEKCLIERQNITKKIDVDVGNFRDVINSKYNLKISKNEIKQKEDEEKTYTPVNTHKKERVMVMVKPHRLYEQFKKDEMFDNLIDFLYSKDLPSKKINLLIVTFIMKWHRFLSINKKKTITRNGYIYPHISKRI